MDFGLYIHIPFCQSKCFYCDFNSYAGQDDLIEQYLATIEMEMHYYSTGHLGQRAVSSIYIGGGTPTLLQPSQLSTLCGAVIDCFSLSSDLEWTIEANPGTLTKEKLIALRDNGVNRLSLGVQSTDPHILATLGRRHNWEDVASQKRVIDEVGFANVSFDLIYGLPGQEMLQWQRTLEQVLSLKPQHLSVYGLKVEEGTLFATRQAAGELPLPEEELEVEMYGYAQELLAREGYSQYEISNFALPGYESRHNLLYWANEEYLGVGAGAYSFLNGSRFAHVVPLGQYMEQWQNNQRPPIGEAERLTGELEMAETVILGLRRLAGINDTDFIRRFGHSIFELYGQEIERLERQGLLYREEGNIALTNRGLLLGNQVFYRFLP